MASFAAMKDLAGGANSKVCPREQNLLILLTTVAQWSGGEQQHGGGDREAGFACGEISVGGAARSSVGGRAEAVVGCDA